MTYDQLVSFRAIALAAALAAAGCAKAKAAGPGGDDDTQTADASCGSACDSDHDGVPDGSDQCPNTPAGQPVNMVGCSDSQLTAMLEPTFPPYGLIFTPSGDLGRAGGLTWTYAGINRGDLFHIYWFPCDDPTTICGMSLDGPIDQMAEQWQVDQADSDLPNGKLVFTNTTNIALADGTSPQLSGRLTVTIADSTTAAIPFSDPGTLNVKTRHAQYGAEIKGTSFQVTAIAEVEDPTSAAWTPMLDYYDAAATPDTGDAGGNAYVSFDGAFYDK